MTKTRAANTTCSLQAKKKKPNRAGTVAKARDRQRRRRQRL